MTKLAIVVMTTLLSTSVFAQDIQLENVRLKTETHKWALDVECRTNLHQDTEVKVKTHPRDIRLDGRITIEQKKKRQSCRVRQLAVVLH